MWLLDVTRLIGLTTTLAVIAGAVAADTVPKKPAPPTPVAEALVLTQDMLGWDPMTDTFVLRPVVLPNTTGRPVISPQDQSPEASLLRSLYGRGRAAGLAGVFYDNRDRGHSAMPAQLFPQLTRLEYDASLKVRGLDYGLAGMLTFPAITFGNSSTAITSGVSPRSQARLAMTEPMGPQRAWSGYRLNQIYIYPEHRDHDEVDLYPANWPYMLVSQGSSRSDKPFLRAVGMILAAFTPETRARLESLGLVSPTVQMVFRRAQTGVKTRADYLSGAAHPSAFSAQAIAPSAMISLANSLRPEDIPPVVELAVEAEDFSEHADLDARSERLFDTPSAIARLWRGLAWQHEMVVSAAATRDPNGRDLTFDWVLLRGDPARVTLTLLDPTGSRARITLNWQGRSFAPLGFAAAPPDPFTDRVDIGVFANNGVHDSAPAFISVSFPTHQQRSYAPVAGAGIQISEVDYDALGRKERYDPLLYWSAPWRDSYHYDAAGKMTGWSRQDASPTPATDYGADGNLADGGVVSYAIDPDSAKKGRTRLIETITPPAP